MVTGMPSHIWYSATETMFLSFFVIYIKTWLIHYTFSFIFNPMTTQMKNNVAFKTAINILLFILSLLILFTSLSYFIKGNSLFTSFKYSVISFVFSTKGSFKMSQHAKSRKMGIRRLYPMEASRV